MPHLKIIKYLVYGNSIPLGVHRTKIEEWLTTLSTNILKHNDCYPFHLRF